MFYIINAISHNPGLSESIGGESLRQILYFGVIIVGIFAVIFLFYTNSFLMKQRKKEVGVYNVLGLGKWHIARMLGWEMLVIAGGSLAAGLLFGIALSKLMFLILLKILHFEVTMKFSVSTGSIIVTVILFGGIFLAGYLFNLLQIRLANPIELLRGGNVGEKEPKTKWVMTIVGVVALGAGYYIAQTTESPLQAIGMFFVAVLLVIIGTYALFTAGSIALLKMLKKNKSFYYNTRHFISVSGMIYRMKQNAVGLANICILSTMVLVMMSASVSLYMGMDDLLKTRFPHEVTVNLYDITEENKEFIRSVVGEIAKKHGLAMTCDREYEYTPFAVEKRGNEFYFPEKDEYISVSQGNFAMVLMMSEEEYNRLEEKKVSLAQDEVLVYGVKTPFKAEEIVLAGKTYRVKEQISKMNVDLDMHMMDDNYYVVMHAPETIQELEERYCKGIGSTFQKDIDFKESGKEQLPALEEMKEILDESGIRLASDVREMERESFYSLYGTILFLGIFLGVLFLMATVLIIYYKQISEGYDDKERFAIMQKVGLSKREVKQSIRSQVVSVFFLPLAAAIVHIAMAFKVITKLLAMMNLTNVPLFFGCTVMTVVVFAVFYFIVFMMTAREYYKIVNG